MKTGLLRSKISKITSHAFWQKEILDYYSVDSSSYQIRPKVVIIPKTTKEISSIVKFAAKNKIPITPRGAGTGLVGSAIGSGIIMDLKNFNKVTVSKNSVVVGAGTLKGNLDVALKEKKKFFGPNPSVGPHCTLGGMIAANASGSRTLKYGATIDNLLELTIVDANGRIQRLPARKPIEKKIHKIAKTSETKFPNVSKNSCGYRLDLITSEKSSYKIFGGSEGTLGIIVSAKLRVYDIPKKRLLQIISYDSALKAARDCPEIIKLKPSALEFVDKLTLKNITYKIPPKSQCLLFAEFDDRIHEKSKKLKKIIHGKIISQLTKEDQINKWWRFRDSSLSYSLRSIAKDERAPHIIEDGTVPVEKLDKMITLISEIRKISNGRVVTYGHAGNGNLHVRLISKSKDKKLIERIAKYYFVKIIQYGGTISGEHGDGLARSKFVKMQYDNNTYLAFKKIKKLLDPNRILNPDKIITNRKSITENLQL